MSERWSEMDDVDLLQLEAEMREELQDLREAATVYAERAWARDAGAVVARPAVRRGWMAWSAAGVTAAALTIGGVQFLHRANMPQRENGAAGVPTVQVGAASPVSDDALLQQIQSDISSGVPAAMEPLQASTEAHSMRDDVVKR